MMSTKNFILFCSVWFGIKGFLKLRSEVINGTFNSKKESIVVDIYY